MDRVRVTVNISVEKKMISIIIYVIQANNNTSSISRNEEADIATITLEEEKQK